MSTDDTKKLNEKVSPEKRNFGGYEFGAGRVTKRETEARYEKNTS